MREWWTPLLHNNPAWVRGSEYQAYAILTMCRALYALQQGRIVSKPVAARWAQETLGPQWSPLIERAWDARHNPDAPATPEDVNETLGFIRFALTQT